MEKLLQPARKDLQVPIPDTGDASAGISTPAPDLGKEFSKGRSVKSLVEFPAMGHPVITVKGLQQKLARPTVTCPTAALRKYRR
jgi:hypothetical protein